MELNKSGEVVIIDTEFDSGEIGKVIFINGQHELNSVNLDKLVDACNGPIYIFFQDHLSLDVEGNDVYMDVYDKFGNKINEFHIMKVKRVQLKNIEKLELSINDIYSYCKDHFDRNDLLKLSLWLRELAYNKEKNA